MNEYSKAVVIEAAQNLKSEDQENPEYDRALVELVMDSCNLSREEAAARLEIPLDYIYPA